VEPHWVEFVERPLPVRGLPRDLDGRALVQISDLHVGARVDETYVVRTLERIRAFGPEFVVFTGDFVSYDATDRGAQLRDVLGHYPLGRLGTAAILGNHDYGPNWSHPEIADEVAESARAAGLTVLRNASAIYSGLQIVGLDDLWGRRFNPERGFADADPAAATVVLSHNPDTVDLPGWSNYDGWILSGHTHGGQCKPPFLPPPILPVRNRRYTAGEFLLSGGRRLYINRGVGHLTQVRFNVRPEVTVFRLQRA
jgi:predicted MPP superfamily phosphohydrolase